MAVSASLAPAASSSEDEETVSVAVRPATEGGLRTSLSASPAPSQLSAGDSAVAFAEASVNPAGFQVAPMPHHESSSSSAGAVASNPA